MITAKEAREMEGAAATKALNAVYGDIKQNAKNGLKKASVKFCEGDAVDKFHKQIIKDLEDNGFNCQYNIDKLMWIDFGFRSIDVSW